MVVVCRKRGPCGDCVYMYRGRDMHTYPRIPVTAGKGLWRCINEGEGGSENWLLYIIIWIMQELLLYTVTRYHLYYNSLLSHFKLNGKK